MADPRARLDKKHPADWSGVELPQHPEWEFVVDDWGCPAWKTETATPRIESTATRAIVRIDDSRTITGTRELPPDEIEYVLFFIGFGQPIPQSEYPDLPANGTLTNEQVEILLDAISNDRTIAGDPIEYEIEVARSDDPRELLSVVEAILDGEFIVTENEGVQAKFEHGKWTLHLLD